MEEDDVHSEDEQPTTEEDGSHSTDDQSASPAEIKTYRHFDQGKGGICWLPQTINEVSVLGVGTYNCHTCMCVCVSLKDRTMFVAHMYAYTVTGSDTLSTSDLQPRAAQESESDAYDLEKWTSGAEKGKQLEQLVYDQLESELGAQKRDQAVFAFMVCPAIILDGPEANGQWMRAAVERFFSCGVTLYDGHGFIAAPEHKGGTIILDEDLETREFEKIAEDLRKNYGWQPAEPVLTGEQCTQRGHWVWGFVHNGSWKAGTRRE